MNLSYNGKSLEASINTYEATEMEQPGHVLGKSYRMLQSHVVARYSSTPLRYRGIAYNS